MISRRHGLVLSLLLGVASATGAFAMIGTAKLGNAETKPELMSSRQIAARARKLDAWEASLQKTLKAKPPALPKLSRYAAVAFVAGPGAVSLPAIAAPSRRTVQHAQPVAEQVARGRSKRTAKVATSPRDADPPERAAPDAAAEPEHATSAPVTVAAAAATPAPAEERHEDTVTTTMAALSGEQAKKAAENQCEALKQAAEGHGEQARKAAEKQCEALKQAAEGH